MGRKARIKLTSQGGFYTKVESHIVESCKLDAPDNLTF
jgi:hypothetical protein